MTYAVIKIEKLKGQKKLRRIIFDSGEYIIADEELIFKFSLREETEISEAQMKEIKHSAEKKRGKDTAFNLLTARPRSEKEIKIRLKIKDVDSEIQDEIIDDLKNLALVNDEDFALRFAQDLVHRKYAGRLLVITELRKKGIKDDIINQTVEHIYTERKEIDIAGRLLEKKRRFSDDLNNPKTKKKYADLLLRRGFNWSVISEVFEQALEST